MPCERCAKKGFSCEYAQLDNKKRIRTTTSELDLSNAARKKNTVKSENKTGSSASEAQKKGGGRSSSNTTSSKPKSAVAESRPTRKNTRIRSGMPAHTSLSTAPSFEDVPLDLAMSPFTTPASFLYRHDIEQSHFTPTMPTPSSLLSTPTSQSLALNDYHSSPASTASYASTEALTSGPAPEAIYSPVPVFSSFCEDSSDAGACEEVTAPSVPMQTAFRHGHHPFRQTCFY